MFEDKVNTLVIKVELKKDKEDVLVNIVLVVMTWNKALEEMVLRNKEPLKYKTSTCENKLSPPPQL